MNRLVLLCLGLMLFSAASSASVQSESSCVTCHVKEKNNEVLLIEQESVHWRAGLGCVGCHGGDPTAKDKESAKADGTGYLGMIPRTAIPELCGSCHSDIRLMNPYGIPTDQLAQYRTSHHGEALFGKGDADVATCADCHHAHGVLSAGDPRSPVYPKNVPETCGSCHSDSDKMSSHGLESDQAELYGKSIHAEMLLEKGDLSAPTCVVCHGNHGAVPPGFARVELVCGKCHIKQKELFDLGPHVVPAQKGDFEACVTCHGNHKVLPASKKLFKTCKLCHEKGDKGFSAARDIYGILDKARKGFEETREKLEEASRAGFETEAEQVLMVDARTYLMQLAPLQHQLDIDKLRVVAAQVEKITIEVEHNLENKKSAIKIRKLAMIPLSGLMILMSFGFWLKKRDMQNKGEQEKQKASEGRKS